MKATCERLEEEAEAAASSIRSLRVEQQVEKSDAGDEAAKEWKRIVSSLKSDLDLSMASQKKITTEMEQVIAGG